MDQEKLSFPAVSFDEFAPTTYEMWKAEAIASLKGGDFTKKLTTKTYEGVTLQPIYTQADVDEINATATFPGYQDYLRGTVAGGYIEKPWDIAQSATAACPKEANALIRHELEKGSTAVNVKIGHDGVSVKSAADVKLLLDGVDLSKVRLHIDCGYSAAEVLGWIAETKTCFPKASGMIGADPIGCLASRGCLPKKLEDLFCEMAKSVKLAAQKAPGVRTVLVDGNVYANGGATAVQEIACCMSTAAAYIEALGARGIDADAAATSIRFSFSLGSNFFMEIAKLRAARVVFSQMVAAFGGSSDAQKIEVFARTSSFTKTMYDPYVNILRATTEAFSGVVGGIDAMEIAPLDEAYGSSDEQTRRVARNMQVMMQEEFGLLQPVDPAGGSWYVETLTAELAKAIWTEFQRLETAGGIVAALRAGTVQADLAKVLADRFSKLAFRTDRAVGTNMYANMLEKKLDRPAKPAAGACKLAAVESVTPIEAHRWTEQFESLRAKTEQYEAQTGKTVKVFLANMGPIPQHKARA
ncbi:MAG: acyl-CoA mutase large subunit family protein, partial [Oscillospiraceae bacterium]